MDYLGHKKLEKNNGIYSSIDGIQAVGGLILLIFVKRMSSHNGVFCSFGVNGSASFAAVLVLYFIQKLVLVIIPEVC